jgi:hypothetical protein
MNNIEEIAVFWDVMLSSFIDRYQYFRGTYYLYLRGRKVKIEASSSSEILVLIYDLYIHFPIRLHGVMLN